MTFRLTMPVPTERQIHEAVADALDALLLPPAFWCAYPAGVVQLSAAQAAAYARFGLKTGMPDIQIWFNGIWLVELKRPGGQLSKTRIERTKHGALREVVGQVERFAQLCRTGAVRDLAVCYSVDDVLDRLAAWQIPHKRIAA
jgi:hypothetical protein